MNRSDPVEAYFARNVHAWLAYDVTEAEREDRPVAIVADQIKNAQAGFLPLGANVPLPELDEAQVRQVADLATIHGLRETVALGCVTSAAAQLEAEDALSTTSA